MTRLAVVTRQPSIADQLRAQFETVRLAPEQCAAAGEASPDAYLVEACLEDWVDFVARLAEGTHRPIVVLLPPGANGMAARYLESGADAVVDAAAPVEECIARLRALTRRASAFHGEVERVFRAGAVTIYADSRRVEVGGTPVRLTRTEFNLLMALAERIDEVVTHRRLMSDVWGPEYVSARHYLRVYVRRLREKIEPDPERPEVLVAFRGKGYMLRSRPSEG